MELDPAQLFDGFPEPVLLLEGEDGAPSREIEAIYGDYRDNPEHRKQ